MQGGVWIRNKKEMKESGCMEEVRRRYEILDPYKKEPVRDIMELESRDKEVEERWTLYKATVYIKELTVNMTSGRKSWRKRIPAAQSQISLSAARLKKELITAFKSANLMNIFT